MLTLNLQKVFLIRNIRKQAAFMKKMGMNYYSARKYYNGAQRQIHLDLIEKLCMELHCTPNDLLEWKPEKEVPGHPLNQLRSNDVTTLAQKLHELPLDKLAALNQWMEQQK